MEFDRQVDAFADWLNSQSLAVGDRLRLETQVESWRDWSGFHSLESIEAWFVAQQHACEMQVTDLPLHDCRDWEHDTSRGEIRHKSGQFFKVQGVRVTMSTGREVGKQGWDQPMLTQIGYDGGLLGILRQRFNAVPHYLLEAKAEPGNPDKVQISPTLQATFSNLKRAHGGNKPRFAEYFEMPESVSATVLFDQWMSEDGGRLHLKRNRGMLVEVPEGAETPVPDGFVWMSLFQIKALIKANSWVNPHVRGIISHL
ncbi:MAG: NDP-hexose 2,3-dehydratase family protein [Pseudomonadota bacterium]